MTSHLSPYLFVICLSLMLAACAPRSAPETGAGTADALLLERSSSEAAQTVERTATLAYHKMEAGFLETGAYNTEVLQDLVPPQGVMWTLEGFGNDSYTLRFSSEEVPGVIWRVSPEGVQAALVDDGS